MKGYSRESDLAVLPHEQLFQRLQDLPAINALVNTTENLYLDCKIWPSRDDDAQRMLAKAVCGFANADGGVVVIGMDARSGPNKDDPDLIQRTAPVPDTIYVKSRIENLIGDVVEPRPESVQLAIVPDAKGSPSGFVIVNVPPTEGLPCRSRKDWKFYQRISAGTYPMEYFQIADMFGRRRRPILALYLEEDNVESRQGRPVRILTVGIENMGRALAKYPSIRFNSAGVGIDPFGIDGNHGFGLPQRPSEPGWAVFGGGADHVIYPGTVLKITKLEQYVGRWLKNTAGVLEAVHFNQLDFTGHLAADEYPSTEQAKTIPAKEVKQ